MVCHCAVPVSVLRHATLTAVEARRDRRDRRNWQRAVDRVADEFGIDFGILWPLVQQVEAAVPGVAGTDEGAALWVCPCRNRGMIRKELLDSDLRAQLIVKVRADIEVRATLLLVTTVGLALYLLSVGLPSA